MVCRLALPLYRHSAIFVLLPAGLEKFLKLTSKLWVQFLESNQVLFSGGFPAHFRKEHSPILIGPSHGRFELNSLIVMFEGFRIVLRALLTKRESEVVMRLSKVRIVTDRLLELNLGGGEILGAHKSDALVVDSENRIANLLSRQVALDCRASTTATATTASSAGAHCRDCPSKHCTNAKIEAPPQGLMDPATQNGRTGWRHRQICQLMEFHFGIFLMSSKNLRTQ